MRNGCGAGREFEQAKKKRVGIETDKKDRQEKAVKEKWRKKNGSGGNDSQPGANQTARRKLVSLPVKKMERVMGVEPTTPTMATSCSTTELHPPRSGPVCLFWHPDGRLSTVLVQNVFSRTGCLVNACHELGPVVLREARKTSTTPFHVVGLCPGRGRKKNSRPLILARTDLAAVFTFQTASACTRFVLAGPAGRSIRDVANTQAG
jgi:hypothetical protein